MKEESMKKVSDVLDSYAYKNGKDHIGNFNDWLAWMCKWFDIHTILECESMSQVFQRAQEENPMYFEAMSHWIDVFNEGVTTHGAWDSFGTIYDMLPVKEQSRRIGSVLHTCKCKRFNGADSRWQRIER